MFLAIFATILGGILLTVVAFRWKNFFDNKKSSNNPHLRVDTLWKEIPLSVPLGWTIASIQNGISLWQKLSNVVGQRRIGCHLIVQGTSEDVLGQLLALDSLLLPNSTSHVIQAKEASARHPKGHIFHDTRQVEETPSLFHYIMASIWPAHYWKTEHTIDRQWCIKNGYAWLTISPKYSHSCTKYGHWCCFLVKDIPAKANETAAVFSYVALTTSLTSDMHVNGAMVNSTEKIIMVREAMDTLFLKQILAGGTARKKSRTAAKLSVQSKVDTEQSGNYGDSEQSLSDMPPIPAKSERKAKLILKMPNEGQEEHPARICSTPVSADSKGPDLKQNGKELPETTLPFQNEIDASIALLQEMYNGTTGQPGWQYIGRNKDIEIWKLPGDAECPWDGYVGTADIKVPLRFALPHLLNPKFKLEWDDLAEDANIITRLDETTTLTHMTYKAIWPVAGRDFCTSSAFRHIKDNMYGVAVASIDFPDCPPVKGKVRAEIIIGGFILEDLSFTECRISYISRAALKGSIPTRMVNKVSSSQPLHLNLIRNKLEQFYKEGNGNEKEGERLLQLAKSKNAPKSEDKNAPDAVSSMSSSTTSESNGFRSGIEKEEDDPPNKLEGDESALNVESEENIKALDVAAIDSEAMQQLISNKFRAPSVCDDDALSEMSFSSVAGTEPTSLSRENSNHSPSSGNAQIDRSPSSSKFQVIGNQAAALLLEEVLLASHVSIKTAPSPDVTGQWSFQGISKDIVMMKKVHASQSVHSFLGRGVINSLPLTVWEAITNPTTRFVYDSMLKKTTMLQEIEDGKYKIIHMRHETTACFVKQARDFVILTSERVDNNKYVLAGISVDYAGCPPTPDCVRGKVLSSGWIIEPLLRSGRLCSLVTYISQINFGGRLPSRLINHISKRQPLSIAYLRDYIHGV